MKKNPNKKVKTKFPVAAGIAGLAVIVLGSILLMIPLRITSLSNSSKIAKLQCQEAGEKLSLKINASADIVRNYSYMITHLVETELIKNENKREFILSQMEMKYQTQQPLNNIWCTFEPNSLDGMDAQFINKMGSDHLGIFSPWFAYDKLINSQIDDYETEYYKIPKETKQEAMSEPYWDIIDGEQKLMITFTVPIMLNDIFLGVLGTDFYINDLTELIAIQNTIGNGKLITDKGIILIHKKHELIGTQINFDYNEVINSLSERKVFDEFDTSEKKDLYKTYFPVQFSENLKPWVYIVEVSANQVYADVRKTVIPLVVIFVLLVLSGYFYRKTIEKKHELEELHTVKDKIFSIVAHDLRSPMGTLASLLKVSNLSSLDPQSLDLIFKDISTRVDDVYGLLDNLLRWAKNQMKGIVFSPVNFDIQNEISPIIDVLQNMATSKKIILKNNTKNQEVFADRDMFSVVVRNLITNALKYTSADGEVTLNSELSENMLVVSVKDTGSGMSEEIQKNLFKMTETKSQRGTNNESGTGLGLVLCAEFVKANGGKIWFTSKEGEGSTFFFSVPVKS